MSGTVTFFDLRDRSRIGTIGIEGEAAVVLDGEVRPSILTYRIVTADGRLTPADGEAWLQELPTRFRGQIWAEYLPEGASFALRSLAPEARKNPYHEPAGAHKGGKPMGGKFAHAPGGQAEEDLRRVLAEGVIEFVQSAPDRIGDMDVFWKPANIVEELAAFEVNDLMGRLADLPVVVERDHSWTWMPGQELHTARIVIEPWVRGSRYLGHMNAQGLLNGVGVKPLDMPVSVEPDLFDMAVLDAVLMNDDRHVFNMIVKPDGHLTSIDQAESFHDGYSQTQTWANGAVNILQTRGVLTGRPRLEERHRLALAKFIRDAPKSETLKSLFGRKVSEAGDNMIRRDKWANALDNMIRRAKWMLRTGWVLSGGQYEFGGGPPRAVHDPLPDEEDWRLEP